jgi:serine phosphatase RsbU (regulator of sigma subunit)
LGWYLYLPVRRSFTLDDNADVIALAVLMATALIVSIAMSIVLGRGDVEVRNRVRAELELAGERASTRTFQLALLPERLRGIDDVSLGACYVAGGDQVVVGGDWYATVPIATGRVGLAIGDVAGRGLPAVAAMAETRFALRTLASEGYPPDVVMDKLNGIMCAFREDVLVTAIYGVLDLEERTWSQVSAGHVPALIVSPKGGVRFLDERPGPPLGVAPDSAYPLRTHVAGPGDLLVMYTDGLVERRGEDLDVGFRRLATAVLGLGLDHGPEELCKELIDRCTDGTPEDDVAVLIARADGHPIAYRVSGSG